MPKNKTIFDARGIRIEIASGTTGDGAKAKVLSLEFREPVTTITDLVKAAMAAQSALMLKASKAKLKASGKAKAAGKKAKGRGKSKVIAEARAPRKRKAPQVEMFQDVPEENITLENMDERFPPEQDEKSPVPNTANSCVLG